jgi:methionine sulfoxide reductase catalytic subunit
MSDIPRSEITPEFLYVNRRQFMTGALTLAGAMALAACTPQMATQQPPAAAPAAPPSGAVDLKLPAALAHPEPYASVKTDERGEALNTYQQITNYNNFYEFSLGKEDVAENAKNFKTLPWQVDVTGLVAKPRIFSMQEILSEFPHEERVVRLRCVEAWSMVIPWVGFPLSALLKLVEPKPEAKFVKFVTVLRPQEMPMQSTSVLNWPYVEGLRLDEAMHPLTILATGLYGKPLPIQDGAPIRLVVPWKYGFKWAKSIVRIELTPDMPLNTWKDANQREYGFYANVNPNVNHPRWTQATERRIGELGRRPTLMYNGYEKEVASLYEGLDLKANY